MKITETMLAGVKILKPTRLSDNRGFFAEIYNRRVFEDLGIDVDFVQENHSLSSEVGTVRGLHFQSPPHAQAKLVRCGRGAIFDVVVDIRQEPNLRDVDWPRIERGKWYSAFYFGGLCSWVCHA